MALELEMHDGVAVARLRGRRLLGEAVAEATAAIEAACARNVTAMVLDGTGLEGLFPPSLAERAAMTRQWAAAANGRVRLAVVVGREHIDAEHFAVILAANYGLTVAAFDNEADAMDWLRHGH